MEHREEFLAQRHGVDKLLEWLAGTDFFRAPASTRFHGACEQGLVMHSLNVYQAYMDRFYEEGVDNLESVTLCTLLHDLCKANYYNVEDQFPYGHGEKSVFLIERFVRLKPAEAVAIRWHMGGFDDAARGGSWAISQAYDAYPLAVKLHMADLTATYLMEKGTGRH